MAGAALATRAQAGPDAASGYSELATSGISSAHGAGLPPALEAMVVMAGAETLGQFVELALAALRAVFGAHVVSFNAYDVTTRELSITSRPYVPTHRAFVELVLGMIDQHPLFGWYLSQPDWTPRRVSDVADLSELDQLPLFRDLLLPAGAAHHVMIPVTPPASGRLVAFVAHRLRDFSDSELRTATHLQAGLVALYHHLAGLQRPVAGPHLTEREQMVLNCLASGCTAGAIAHRLDAQPATIRKHLQNIYAKLEVSDRLGAVMRARELGLLAPQDVAGDLSVDIRTRIAATTPRRGR